MKLQTCLILCCLLATIITVPNISGQQEDVTDITIDWPCYVSTKITFNYPYTHEHSISNITTIGQSVYKHSGGPDFLSFIAQDVDVYSFVVTLTYLNTTQYARTILIGLWSGDQPMKGFTIKVATQKCVIRVRLELTEQPTYPTESEVAQEVVRQIEQKVVDLIEQNRQLTEEVRLTSLTASIFGVIAATASVIAVALAGFSFRRRHEVAAD